MCSAKMVNLQFGDVKLEYLSVTPSQFINKRLNVHLEVAAEMEGF